MPDTRTIANALQDSMPDVFKSQDDAEKAARALLGSIARHVKEGEPVFLQGIGEIRQEADTVVFTPDRRLLDTIRE